MASFGILLILILTKVIIYSALGLKGAFIFIIILAIVTPLPPKIVCQLGSQWESGGTFKEIN